jgi:predicted metal-dependent phosphoesterase TrpH
MYSFDSFVSPEKIIKTAQKKNLDGVAITDHGTIRGGLNAKKIKSDIVTIIGSEVKTEIGDLIGLFLNEEIKSCGIWDVIEEIRDQDGIIVIPHPFRSNRTDFDHELIRKIDAIEGYNARTELKKNIQAQDFAKLHDLPVTAGSDAHFSREIGLARTIMDPISSEEDIRKSITSGNMHIEGTPAPLYFRGASRLVTDFKAGEWYRLPYTFYKISLKGAKSFSSRYKGRQ